MPKRDCRAARAITGVIIRNLPLHTAATKSQRAPNSAAWTTARTRAKAILAALSKTEIEDLHQTATEAVDLTRMATAPIAARDTNKTFAKEASTQTESGVTNLELLQAYPQSRLLARPAFSYPVLISASPSSFFLA